MLAAAALWGTTGTAQALAPPGAQPAAVGAARLLVGGLALLAVAAVRRALFRNRHWPIWPTLAAAGCMAGYQLCFFAGVARTGVAVGTMVAIGSAPVLAGALGFLIYGDRPVRKWFGATALAILGCSILAMANSELNVETTGILLALGAGACYATYTVASKRLLESQPPEAAIAVVFCLGAFMLTPVLFLSDLSWLNQPRGQVVILHLGLVATAAAYILFARGLKIIPAATAVTLSLAEPLTAGLLGVLLLGEVLATSAWIGIALLFGGLALLAI